MVTTSSHPSRGKRLRATLTAARPSGLPTPTSAAFTQSISPAHVSTAPASTRRPQRAGVYVWGGWTRGGVARREASRSSTSGRSDTARTHRPPWRRVLRPCAVVLIVYSRANVLGVTPPIPAPSSVHAGRIGRARTDVALHARLAARSRPPHGGCCVPPDSQLLLIVPGRARLRERGGWRCRRCGLMAWRAGATGRLGGVWPTAWCRLLSTAARAAFLGCFGSAWRVDERGRLDDTPVLSRCCSFLVVPCVLALGALPRICPASSPSEDASPAASSRRASAVCQDANPAARDARPALFPHLL